jgi:hypothetical protein
LIIDFEVFAGAEEDALMVSTLVVLPTGITAGSKVPSTPLGSLEIDRATGPQYSSERVTVTVTVPEAPCWIVAQVPDRPRAILG